MNTNFPREKVQMANKYLKKCLVFLAIRVMQIKTALRFYLTPVGMATVQNSKNNRGWLDPEGKGPFLHWQWKHKLA